MAHHGICIPLFSIRTASSSGIGEFLDLIPLIDWCHSVGMDMIQLLPINDSNGDPSPYNAASSCALNPIYLSLHKLPYLEEHPDLQNKLQALQPFNHTQRVCYHDVLHLKMSWLRAYFDRVGLSLVTSPEFSYFVEHEPWIKSYSLFRALRDRSGGSPYQEWPPDLKNLTKETYDQLIQRAWPEMCFYIALQLLCFQQMRAVKTHAASKQVLLMGDIPFLIGADSADAWHEPDLFDLTVSAGAPADIYNVEGQYWGLPVFHWERIKKDHYLWWRIRLAAATPLYDYYRIDHVVGFFRIWSIPLAEPAKNGKFLPEDEALWTPQGRDVLEMMLKASPLKPIAEDLGTVPKEVRATLQQLGIPGTKVIRWERNWDGDEQFIPFEDYPRSSLTCVSTHDSEPLELWWRDKPDEAQAFAAFKGWEYSPNLTTDQRKAILSDSHHTPSYFHINLLQEYLALFPELVWGDPEDERINIPGTQLPTNWTYRFRPSLEELDQHAALKTTLRSLIQ
jgi:4-alpha-glucanotransferase